MICMIEKPYIVTYKSKPIKGIVLELWSINPNYKTETELFLESLKKFANAMNESGISGIVGFHLN